jgi:uncharacterized protein YndB with AHSA1/START domain
MIDVRTQINAVRRTLGGRALEAGEARVSTISQAYDTDLDDLWEVVTTASRIERWFLPVTGELKEGGHYQLTGNAGGTITRCERPHGFDATWEMGDMVSWIEVRLTAEPGGGSRFTLEHIGFVPDDMWERFGPGATGVGWDGGFYGLAGHLTDPGAALDPAQAVAWMATDEGKLMLRLSSDAWVAADIAYGTDPAVAAARGAQTYAFYTGT